MPEFFSFSRENSGIKFRLSLAPRSSRGGGGSTPWLKSHRQIVKATPPIARCVLGRSPPLIFVTPPPPPPAGFASRFAVGKSGNICFVFSLPALPISLTRSLSHQTFGRSMISARFGVGVVVASLFVQVFPSPFSDAYIRGCFFIFFPIAVGFLCLGGWVTRASGASLKIKKTSGSFVHSFYKI